MALGFIPALLGSMQRLADPNYGGTKITAAGFLGLLLENNPDLAVSMITLGDGTSLATGGMKLNTVNGQVRDVKVKYLPRILSSQVGDQDDCTTDFVFQYKESDINAPFYKQVPFYLDWNFLERYEADAAQSINIGRPAIGAVREMETQILHALNGIISSIDANLLNSVVFGVNPAYGNNSTQTININQSGTTLNLEEGLVRLLADAQQNEIADDLLLVGNGLMNNYMIARQGNALGFNQAGFNVGGLGGFRWYYDINSIGAWGANDVAAFAKGNVGFVDIDKWIGWKTGRFGTSYFATGMFPIGTPRSAGANVPAPLMSFNIQVQEVDCPTAGIATGYGNGTYTAGRGWKVIISKNFGLWQYPTDSFQPTDRLSGMNGAFSYNITNSCAPCPEA